MNFRPILILIIMVSLFAGVANSETRITGTVKSEDKKPLSTVMVKTYSPEGKEWHTKTGKDGRFAITIPTIPDSVKIRFSKLGYETETFVIHDFSIPVSIELHRTSTLLKEVTVKAPSVRLKGDTIVYDLAAFAGKGDVTLQDALKKVPGVEVENSGGIKYNGKSISNFYINGMDLLGGKYNIATTSIPHSYVSAVEILNNHQNKKIDRNVFNDNVALNIRLKPKAMFKPMGKYGLKAGYGDKLMGEASGAGMMFTDNFQTILTLKAGNVNEFSSYDHVIHYSYDNRNEMPNYAGYILGNLSASTPPLNRTRWIRPVDLSTTLNFINKLSKDATLRTNIGYEYTHTDYDYSEDATYFAGKSDVVVKTSMSPSAYSHKPSFSVEYKLNSDDRYIRNSISGNASFSTYRLPVDNDAYSISQAQDMKSFNIYDFFDINWRRGKMKWNSETFVQLRANPEGIINVSGGEDPEASLLQTARSYSLRASELISGVFEYKRSRIYLPVSFAFNHNRIHSRLQDDGYGDEFINAENHLTSDEFKFSISPSYEYSSRYNRFVFRAGVPLSVNIYDRKNSGTIPAANNKVYLSLSPSVYANFDATSKSTFGGGIDFHNSYGDILDLMTSPVMTDYMSMQLKSGIISHTKRFNSSLRYSFKSPLTLWNFRIDAGYSKGWNNLMSRQYVSSGLITISNYLSPNNYDSFNSNITLSKQFRELHTKITLNGSFNRSRNETEQNDMRVKYYGTTYSFSPNISTNPLGWFELDYDLFLSFTSTKFRDMRRSYTSQNHDIGLKFYPGDDWEINFKSDITRKEISEKQYKTMSLFDAGAVYKFKSLRFGLELRNIFDCKSYSYTIFNGLDRFSYSYGLRGRELLLSFTFIK